MTEKLLNTLKYTFVTVNFFYMITGCILLYLGISIEVEIETFEFLPWNFLITWFCIGLGIFILLVAALGFYGALKENYIINVLFAAAMFLTFILQLSNWIACFVTRDDSFGTFPSPPIRYDGATWIANQWNILQERFQCCGKTSPSDWLNPLPDNSDSDSVNLPLSCCPRLNTFYKPSVCTIDNSYTRGCENVFMNFANYKMDSVLTAGAYLSLMQGLIFVSVASALWMVKAAKEDKENSTVRR